MTDSSSHEERTADGGGSRLSIAERLTAARAALSPQERRAADFMRDNLADLAVYNATEVARLSGVSKATVSRLYRRLGFDTAEDLRDHVRAVRATGTPLASDEPTNFAAHLEHEIANLRASLAGLDLSAPSAAIAAAHTVVVVGFRNSYPVALHLRQQLAQARDGVVMAPQPGQSLGEEIATLGPDDVVIVVGFRRRPQSFGQLMEHLAASPAQIILLTDNGGRRSERAADYLLTCPVDSVTAFDSYASAFSVVSVLAAAVLSHNLTAGRARIAAIGRTYDGLDELETPL